VEATGSSETTVRFARLCGVLSKKPFTFVAFTALGTTSASFILRKISCLCWKVAKLRRHVFTGEYHNLNVTI
jgi:hypothetical protein